MRSFYMRIFKNIICIYVLALCCFAYATMIHAIPDHVYVQEGQKLELDKKIPVTLAMSTKPQSVMAQIGERTFQAMKQERAVETCSQLKQGEYTLTCYLFGILPMKEVQVSVVNGKSLYVSGQVVGIYGAAQGVLVLGSGPVETVDGSSAQPAEHIVFPGDYITAVNGKAVTKKEELMERINQYGEQPVVLTLWRGAEQIQVSVEPVEAAEHKGYRLGLWVKDDMAGIGTLTYFDQDGNFVSEKTEFDVEITVSGQKVSITFTSSLSYMDLNKTKVSISDEQKQEDQAYIAYTDLKPEEITSEGLLDDSEEATVEATFRKRLVERIGYQDEGNGVYSDSFNENEEYIVDFNAKTFQYRKYSLTYTYNWKNDTAAMNACTFNFAEDRQSDDCEDSVIQGMKDTRDSLEMELYYCGLSLEDLQKESQ